MLKYFLGHNFIALVVVENTWTSWLSVDSSFHPTNDNLGESQYTIILRDDDDFGGIPIFFFFNLIHLILGP